MKYINTFDLSFFETKRKVRDSNPRYSYPYNDFRDRPDRPLRQLSLSYPFNSKDTFFVLDFIE